MLNLDCHILGQVVSKALADAADHPRWINAIRRAFEEIDSNPYIARGELHGLVIGSPSGRLYSANGTCQCEAYLHGHACWHRAAARLVRLHDEAQQHRELAAAGRARQADDAGDIDFSQDEPTVGIQLARLGVRRAQGWEDAQLVTVTEFGKPFQIRVMPIEPPSARQAAARMATAQLNDLFA